MASQEIVSRIRFLLGDITRIPADVIVNAANSALRGGSGVNGAIHREGGPEIMRELDRIRPHGGLPPGKSVLTGAGTLPARYVAHTVGPIWGGGNQGETGTLASAYRETLSLAAGVGARIVTFPSISTGSYGYPVELAAPVALTAIASFLQSPSSIEEILFVFSSRHTCRVYEEALRKL